MEKWKDVVGYENLYEVSDLGRVRNSLTKKVRKTPLNSAGYPHLTLRFAGKTKTHNVHALVAAAFLGPRPVGQEVRHKNGKRDQSALSNLEYGTPKQNGEDRILHGTSNVGESNVNATLTAEIVREMRALKGTMSGREIGRRFGLSSPAHANKILRGEAWRHV